jgi:uncharacterized membrane protein
MKNANPAADKPAYPISAGVFLGLGLGGFFDGIVLHQILQWHHMLSSAGHPIDSLANLSYNTLWDGLFHAATYVFVLIGLLQLWRAARRLHRPWSTRVFAGSILLGFGLFNLIEGIVNHQLLGLHHVNETVAERYWIYWDMGFLLWGLLMVVGGGWLMRAGARQPSATAEVA